MNSHGTPDTLKELQAIGGDLWPPVILGLLGFTVPAPPALTVPGLQVWGYVRDGADLIYVQQLPHRLTLSGGDGLYWLALHRQTANEVSGWTREPGTHLLWQAGASLPANPGGALVFASLTVAGGVITAVSLHAPVMGPPLSQQVASAVSITGGGASLTALSVAETVQAQRGVNVDNFSGDAVAYASSVAAGAGTRYFLYHTGTAPSLLSGPLQVNHAAGLGLNAAPVAGFELTTPHARLDTNFVLVSGTGYKLGGGPWTDASSRTLKKHIAPIVGALALLCRLEGRTFEWEEPTRAQALPGPQYGMIAEEVEAVLPQWVGTSPEGVPTLTPVGFEALVIEALKAIAGRLEALEARA